MSAAFSVSLLVLSPLAAAALAFALPKFGRWIGLLTAAITGASAVALAHAVLSGGTQVHRVGGWGAPLGIDLRADGLAVLMLLLTAGISGAVVLYSQDYFTPGPDADEKHRAKYFWPLLFFLWTALNALFLSTDTFNLYVTLELIAFAGAALVALTGTRAALNAALRYFYVSLMASLLYLLGVALIYAQCGTVDIALLSAGSHEGAALVTALALMSAGLIMKAALFPMHFWLPPAHANSPAPVSALLSALVVKGAFYILLRIWFEAFPGFMSLALGQFFGCLGAVAIVWGSLNAWFQPRLKLLIAYSSVAQLGYLFLLFPLAAGESGGFAAWHGGLVFLAAHASAKAAMFLAAGNMLHAAGHDRIRELDGITHVLPVSIFAFGLAGFSLVGLPPSGGFAGKWLLLSSALAQGQWWWAAIILLGSLLTAAYVMRVLTHAFTRVREPDALHPVSRAMEGTALVLALVAAGLGFAGLISSELISVGAPIPNPGLAEGGLP